MIIWLIGGWTIAIALLIILVDCLCDNRREGDPCKED